MKNMRQHRSTTHWGAFDAHVKDGEITAVSPAPGDDDPAPMLQNLVGSVRHNSRVARPAVRRGWLNDGPGPTSLRGADEFVEVSWDDLVGLLADELRRVVDEHGNEAIYGSSYGWGSAGRFHHAQSQVHRFLNLMGGYTSSQGAYSFGASQAIFPHIFGDFNPMLTTCTTWDVMAPHTDLIVAFGGIPRRNTMSSPGGVTSHPIAGQIRQYLARGGEIASLSPIRDDIDDIAGAGMANCRWYAPVPGTDVPIMLGLAHVLAAENLLDRAFLERCCVGYERFERYLLGHDDGVPKTPEWAAEISGLPADELRQLARKMTEGRTMITTTWSLQRTQHGEQPPWMSVTLAAMLGQIGLPGGGVGHGYGSAAIGNPTLQHKLPSFPQGRNPVKTYIPVAAVTEMLTRPGEQLAHNGKTLTLPHIKLMYWAGGNPFHHHQHLARFRRALGLMDTIVVHEQYWTAMAKHADIVVPSTTPYERDDFAGGTWDSVLSTMPALAPRHAEAKDDYDAFAALAYRLGFGDEFTEGRTAMGWLEHMYESWADRLELDLPTFKEFWAQGRLQLPVGEHTTVFADFRADPHAHPLRTPSGRIELFSETIASFEYDDCEGHAKWYEPVEWLGGPRAEEFPLHLIANQPRTRLHSQLDHGAASVNSKIQGREPIRMHPSDGAQRGIATGDIVRVFNDRGACLAGAILDEGVRRNVVQLATGAWFAPEDPADPDSMCVHGNPNALTSDRGTSRLAQACTGQHVLVQIEKFQGPLPPIRAYEPPTFTTLDAERTS